jgi:hypothetical protein
VSKSNAIPHFRNIDPFQNRISSASKILSVKKGEERGIPLTPFTVMPGVLMSKKEMRYMVRQNSFL